MVNAMILLRGIGPLTLAFCVSACGGGEKVTVATPTDGLVKFGGAWKLASAGGKTPPIVTFASATDTTTRFLATLEVFVGSLPSTRYAMIRDSIVRKAYIGPTVGWFSSNLTGSGIYDASVRGDTLRLDRNIATNSGPVLLFVMRPDGSLLPVDWISGTPRDERWTR